jgi:hypothetical protein
VDTRIQPSTGFHPYQSAETVQISSGAKWTPESENLLRAPSGQQRSTSVVCAYLLIVVCLPVLVTLQPVLPWEHEGRPNVCSDMS